MFKKAAPLAVLFLFSSLLLDSSWGQLVDKIDLVHPLPVPIKGEVAVEGNVNVVNSPEVIIKSMPDVSVSGDVNIVNSPEVKIADVARVEVVNEAGQGIPVRVTNPLAQRVREDPQNVFSWSRRSSLDGKDRVRTHSAIAVSKMAQRYFVLTDLVVTSRFRTPGAQFTVSIKGAGTDRGLGMDFFLTPDAPHLVSHFQTGIVFQPDVAVDVLVSGEREGGQFQIDYAITFSGYFLPKT